MRAKGNWNGRQNAFIPVPHTTQTPNSKNHSITNTLSDIPTGHVVVIGTIINEIIH